MSNSAKEEWTWEKQNHVLKYEQKSYSKWLLYSITGVFPVLLGVFILIQMGFSNKSKLRSDYIDYITPSVPIMLLFIIVEATISHLKNLKLYRLNDTISSISMGILSELVGLFSNFLVIFPYGYIHANYAILNIGDEISWTVWWIMFLCVEYGYYWFHRFAHEWNVGWAAHSVHHSSEEYNLSTALRQGCIQGCLSWCFYLPFAFLFPPKLFFFHRQLNTLYQFWIHTRLIGKLGPLEWILNTPSHHRVHHGKNAKYLDKNYGGTLIIFDRIFGTFQEEEEEVVYGITHRLGTWNPLYHQFEHWFEIFKTFKKTKGIWNKIRVFLDFGPTYNWRVLSYDKFVSNKKWKDITPQMIKKYDKMVKTTNMYIYIFFHFCIMVIYFYLAVTIGQSEIEILWKLIFTFYVVFYIYSICAIMDQRWCARHFETLRIIIGYILTIYYFPNMGYMNYILIGVSFISLIWIWFSSEYKMNLPKKED